MTVPLEEQLFELVAVKLATITVANGYLQTVANVYRPPQAPQRVPVSDCPALAPRQVDKDSRYHLRDCEEMTVTLRIMAMVDAAGGLAALHNLLGDVRKLAYANQRWNDGTRDLAVRTWVANSRPHETEVDEAVLTGMVEISIVARSNMSDPSVVQPI